MTELLIKIYETAFSCCPCTKTLVGFYLQRCCPRAVGGVGAVGSVHRAFTGLHPSLRHVSQQLQGAGYVQNVSICPV